MENTELVVNVEGGVATLTNFESVKTRLNEILDSYKVVKVNNANINDIKKQRAELNGAEKAFVRKRIDEKNNFLAPFVVVEDQIKELEKLIKKVSKQIDDNIKEFEDAEKDEKQNEIIDYFDSLETELIMLDIIWNDKWLNKTFSLNNVKKEIDAIINDLRFIEENIGNDKPALKERAKVEYIDCRDLSLAVKNAESYLTKQQEKYNEEDVVVKENTIIVRCNEAQWKALIAYATSIGIAVRKA